MDIDFVQSAISCFLRKELNPSGILAIKQKTVTLVARFRARHNDLNVWFGLEGRIDEISIVRNDNQL